MLDATIVIEGQNRLARELRNVDGDVRKHLRKVYLEASKQALAYALPEVPVRTGRLRKSVKPAATQRSGGLKAGTARRVPYANPIHWGWPRRNIRPNRFFIRTMKRYEKQLTLVFHKAMTEYTRQWNRTNG